MDEFRNPTGHFAYQSVAEADTLKLAFTGSGEQAESWPSVGSGEPLSATLNGHEAPFLCAAFQGLRCCAVLADPQGHNMLELTLGASEE